MIVVAITLYGVFACWTVVVTRSLWMAIGVHFAWNTFEGPVYGFPLSGISTPTIIHQTARGPEWFTGGSFGPESGVVILIPLALAVAVIYGLRRLGAFDRLPDLREAYAKGGPAKTG